MSDSAASQMVVIGNTVRLVMLLQTKAAPGTTLCSGATNNLVQRVVRAKAVHGIEIDACCSLLPVYSLLGRRRERRPLIIRQKRAWTPYVGRTRELETLYALWAQVQEGRGQVVGVVGEPGIGKSRLLAEFHQRLRGRPVTCLTGHCLSHGQGTPYLPIISLLRQYCGLTERVPLEAITTKLHMSLRAGRSDSRSSSPLRTCIGSTRALRKCWRLSWHDFWELASSCS
jgi:hypothetical protein